METTRKKNLEEFLRAEKNKVVRVQFEKLMVELRRKVPAYLIGDFNMKTQILKI